MIDLQNKLNNINETKELLKQAIINKGVSINPEDPFRLYSNKIDEISTASFNSRANFKNGLIEGSNGYYVIDYIKDINLSDISFTGYERPLCALITEGSYTKRSYNIITLKDFKFSGEILTNSEILGCMFGERNLTESARSHVSVNTLNIENWDLSNITTTNKLEGLFKVTGYSLNNSNVTSNEGSLNTLNIKNIIWPKDIYFSLQFTFEGVDNVNIESNLPFKDIRSGLNININLSNCEPDPAGISLSYGFLNNRTLQTLILPKKPYICKQFESTFYNCSSLENLDLSNMDTSNMTSTFNNVFSGCKNLKNVIWPKNFLPVGQQSSMILTSSTQLTKESLVSLMNNLASNPNNCSIKLSSQSYTQLTADEIKIAQDKGWTILKV